MNVPEQFAQELDNTFHGRFRLRWSDSRSEWQLEQKVAIAKAIPPPVDDSGNWDTYDDNFIRARDGYFYVMSFTVGDRMPCPLCGLSVAVPIMETRESVCEHCRFQGRDGRYKAAFYPLNHVLIEHLRYIDPLTDGIERVKVRMRDKQIRTRERLIKSGLDDAEHGVLSNKTQVEQNPMSGYGVKHAPAR